MRRWFLFILMGGGGAGSDVDNLLLETGDNLLQEDGVSVLKLE